jgi:D-serine deaminase-like pyridoxal phosphate-dependent protein
MESWFEIENIENLNTPSLVFFRQTIEQNIDEAIKSVKGDVSRLRPHIKTFKCGNILEIFKQKGIEKVKTATIEETLLAAELGIKDVLFAYQPNSQKALDFIAIIKKCQNTVFSTLLDNLSTASELNELAIKNKISIDYFIDINAGMNRTGFAIEADIEGFLNDLFKFSNLKFRGFHLYDGHLKGLDFEQRTASCLGNYEKLKNIKLSNPSTFEIAAGGTNTFLFYAKNTDAICCPGTFVLWDDNYDIHLPELSFQQAAIVIGQVVSKPCPDLVCVDIGYKAISSENDINHRLRILNFPSLVPFSHSEEHLVLTNEELIDIPIGTIVYAQPYHICPTVALYNVANVVNEHGVITQQWNIKRR